MPVSCPLQPWLWLKLMRRAPQHGFEFTARLQQLHILKKGGNTTGPIIPEPTRNGE